MSTGFDHTPDKPAAPFHRSCPEHQPAYGVPKFFGSIVMRRWVPTEKIVQALKQDDDGEYAFRVFLAISLVSLAAFTVVAGFAAR